MISGNTEVEFNEATGTIRSLKYTGDTMNWCDAAGEWGAVRIANMCGDFEFSTMAVKSLQFTENGCTAVYEHKGIEVEAKCILQKNGNLTESYTIKNTRNKDVFLKQGDIGFQLPLSDRYTNSLDCMQNHCNVHIWCGYNTTYINALKMGNSDINLGLVLKKGSIPSYSISQVFGGYRGIFVLDCEPMHLHPGETATIEWEVFWTAGREDFYKKAADFDAFVNIKAPHFTVFDKENICFDAFLPVGTNSVTVICDGEKVEYTRDGRTITVNYTPQRIGEHRFDIFYDNKRTYAEFLVSEPFEVIVKKRVNFIIDKQQCNDKGGSLDGAYLVYDNKCRQQYYDASFHDHNATRERIGMALLMAKYLQTHQDDTKVAESLDRYITFLKREFYDENTGEVFNEVGRDNTYYRLYNNLWVAQLFAEMYILTEDSWYLVGIKKIFDNYYDKGGKKFYPNAVEIGLVMKAFENSPLETTVKNELMEAFKIHVENMIEIGSAYPPHEVKYEQTIVAPAVTFISQMGLMTGDKRYLIAVNEHIENLNRFNGNQPSYHLNQIPIRYWDGYWFGKLRARGDTFPHYWSCLTARAFMDYYLISNEDSYRLAAIECMRNCLCLFNEKGEGSAAYMYPFRIGNREYQVYDDWANDQDFALYFAMEFDL